MATDSCRPAPETIGVAAQNRGGRPADALAGNAKRDAAPERRRTQPGLWIARWLLRHAAHF
jgi:hypothetical protein